MLKIKKSQFSAINLFQKQFRLSSTFNFLINKRIKYNFCSKDDAFWEEYTRRKSEGGKYPALESQEIIVNKVIHSWKFAKNHALSNDEFLLSLRELEPNKSSPFIVLDVREEIEYELYKLPQQNKKGAQLPIYYREIKEINHGNFEDIPLGKYVICIDGMGLRGRMAARYLSKEGYLALYVEGGFDMFIPLAQKKEI